MRAAAMRPGGTAEHPRRAGRVLLLALLAVAPGACASAGGAASGAESMGGWAGLVQPRPEPLDGAAAVALGDLTFLPAAPFDTPPPLTPGTAVMELLAAGLLQRRDIRFVERRRFAAAAERARTGQPAMPGQPPLGTSRSAEYVLQAVWARSGARGRLDVRLTDPASGRVVEAWRTETPASPGAVGLARAMADGLAAALHGLGRLPSWDDPVQRRVDLEAGAAYSDDGVPPGAVGAFLEGIAAEDGFEWDAARRAYERAMRAGGDAFPEARAALARAARLRAGGTLAESEDG